MLPMPLSGDSAWAAQSAACSMATGACEQSSGAMPAATAAVSRLATRVPRRARKSAHLVSFSRGNRLFLPRSPLLLQPALTAGRVPGTGRAPRVASRGPGVAEAAGSVECNKGRLQSRASAAPCACLDDEVHAENRLTIRIILCAGECREPSLASVWGMSSRPRMPVS